MFDSRQGQHLSDVDRTAADEGKHTAALVTGAAGGIGRAICHELGDAGFRIFACDLDEGGLDQLARELEDRGLWCKQRAFDLRDPAACAETISWVERTAGSLDVLVNNAAVWFFEDLLDSTDEHWRTVLEVNVIAPVRLARLAASLLARSSQGRIVNVASSNAFLGEQGWASYDVSKAALVALTRALAYELAEASILVNAVAPGFIATESNRVVLGDAETSELYLGRIPLGRFGRPDEVAKAVAFLAGTQSTFVTGSTLSLDGGRLAGQESRAGIRAGTRSRTSRASACQHERAGSNSTSDAP